MRDKALYFPLIAVPQTRWTVNTLLYWDALATIVPLDHTFAGPNNQFMRELVHKKLVLPIFPREHLYQIPDYEDVFVRYLRRKAPIMRERAATLFHSTPDRVPIHLEKMSGIGDELVALGLAQRRIDDWYDVDRWAANHLMTYLAAALGQLGSVGAAPMTDDAICFRLLAGNASLRTSSEARLTARTAILARILPLPGGSIDLDTIAEFKSKQGGRLSEFRREIESRCIAIARADEADRPDILAIAMEELSKERDKIVGKMKSRFSDILLGSVNSVVGAGIAMLTKPLIDPKYSTLVVGGAGFSLINAVYRALRANQDYVEAVNKPMAYAAEFRRSIKLGAT